MRGVYPGKGGGAQQLRLFRSVCVWSNSAGKR